MVIRCSECGTQNPDNAERCSKCGASLSVGSDSSVVEHTGAPLESAVEKTQSEASTKTSWWKRLSPDWKVSLILALVWAALTTLTSVTAGASCIFSFPFHIAFSLGQGVLVGRIASQDPRYTEKEFVKLGLRSGLWSSLIDIILSGLTTALVLGASLGAFAVALPPIIIAHLGVIALKMTLVFVGTWLYIRYGGKKLVGALTVVGILATILVCVLMVIISAILATAGITLWNQFG